MSRLEVPPRIATMCIVHMIFLELRAISSKGPSPLGYAVILVFWKIGASAMSRVRHGWRFDYNPDPCARHDARGIEVLRQYDSSTMTL